VISRSQKKRRKEEKQLSALSILTSVFRFLTPTFLHLVSQISHLNSCRRERDFAARLLDFCLLEDGRGVRACARFLRVGIVSDLARQA
jgi:hypothetical protein